MWEWLAGGAAAGLVLGIIHVVERIFVKLHTDAIQSESKRADAAERRAEAAEKRADEREVQLGILLGRPKEPTL